MDIFIIVSYLKYKYSEVYIKIKLNTRFNVSVQLIENIVEYNSICIITHKLNEFMKYVLYIIYYMVTPNLEITLFLIFDKQSTLL